MDVLGVAGAFHFIGLILYMEIIAIRLNKKITNKIIAVYAIVWTAILTPSIYEYAAKNEVGMNVVGIFLFALIFIAMDLTTFYMCRLLYRRFPRIGIWFGHETLKEKRRKKQEVDSNE